MVVLDMVYMVVVLCFQVVALHIFVQVPCQVGEPFVDMLGV